MRISRLMLTMLLLGSCVAASDRVVVYPLPETNINVRGNMIYHNHEPFAELRYFDTLKASNAPDSYRGLVIYYYPYDKEVWILPKEGWSIRLNNRDYSAVQDINRIWAEFRGKRVDPAKGFDLLLGGKPPTKEQILTTRAYDVRISENGKYVYYRTEGMLLGSTHKYLVEYGVSE
jgi:hypothetical protein